MGNIQNIKHKYIYLIFFLSGIAGLIYQIVWTRLLYLIFGVSTHSIVAVTSSFMAGLGLGSYLSGRFAPKQKNILKFYAILEITIGVTAIIVPLLLSVITSLYTSLYHVTASPEIILIVKFLLSFIAILIPTTAMGATLPVVIEYMQRNFHSQLSLDSSLLYAINTLGAFIGVVLSGFVLIEVLGLTYTVWVAIMINLSLGIGIYLLSRKDHSNKTPNIVDQKHHENTHLNYSRPLILALTIFSLSGLISMVYEIAWIRLLTPITGTFIYAFSFILALFLLGIALGSFLYKFLIPRWKSTYFLFAFIEVFIGLGAVLSVLATTDLFSLPPLFTQILVILPSTIAMGLTFPTVMNLAPPQIAGSTFVGIAYTLNTLGSMVGPIIGGFILLPNLGSSMTIIYLSLLNFIFAALLALSDRALSPFIKKGFIFICLVMIFSLSFISQKNPNFFKEKTLKNLESMVKARNFIYSYHEDEAASVFAFKNKEGMESGLLVNGIGMTSLVEETKLMAHLPILIHKSPKDMLIICFGMGTTFRSALTYNINVDAVELIPSVVKMFPVFFPDAQKVLSNPKGKIYTNDGRNFVRVTTKKYDIIQVDPPPPVNAAGTTVLYSKGFYQDSKKILKENGLFLQWIFFGTKEQDVKMLIKSFVDVFPYVSSFISPHRAGLFLIGSDKPIVINKSLFQERLNANPAAVKDLNEWGAYDVDSLLSLYDTNQDKLKIELQNIPSVTDLFPRTEYFLLRHYLSK